MGHVAVVGSINADLHLRLARHITPGETLLASGGTFSPGGKGANQALAARRAGSQVTLLGAVGDDDLGSSALHLLAESGVDLSHLIVIPGPTGLAVVSVDAQGENTVVVVPGANGGVLPEMVDARSTTIAQADVVVVQGEISAASSLAASRHASGRVVLNLAPVIEMDHDLLRSSDPLVVNETEGEAVLAQLSGSAKPTTTHRAVVDALLALGVRSVVMTLGAEGSIVGDSDGVVEIGSPAMRAVDTVGAGDAYCGSLAARLAEGDSLIEAATFASRFAAYTVQWEGAQSSYPPAGAALPE